MRRCTTTGLTLVASTELPATTYRVAGRSWGPLNPPRRPAAASEVDKGWGRFDTPGGRTLYAAKTPEGALAEVLASFRVKVGERSALEKDAAFLGLSPAQFRQVVEEEWLASGHMPPGQLARGWRTSRLMYTIAMPRAGHWIWLDSMDTLGAIERALADQLRDNGVESVTLSALTGDNRALTVPIAAWIRGLTMDDGGRPHGIVFPSKHGGAHAYAYWMRRVDDGEPVEREPIGADSGRPIGEGDSALHTVAARFGIRVH